MSDTNHTYAPLQLWKCDECGTGGQLGRFAAGKYSVESLAFAERLHETASPGCKGVVRVTQDQGQYSD
jgi:hypothetical protein